MSFHAPDRFRVRSGQFGTDDSYGNNGAFFVKRRTSHVPLKVIASDGGGWEHVSVSLPDRCPTWADMCAIKDLFWDEQDCVMQLHPPRSEYVNNHPYCLHLWRPIDAAIPLPPSLMVGFKSRGLMHLDPECAAALMATASVLLEAGAKSA